MIFAPFAELVEFKAFLELFLVLFTAISDSFAGNTFEFNGVILWHTGCYGQIISDRGNPVNWLKGGISGLHILISLCYYSVVLGRCSSVGRAHPW